MNLSIWEIMAPAFFECLILVGIHSYLGIHVIKRKVIFVDLALAQVAALGTTVGFLFGIMPGTIGAYWFSLAFAILGAGIFSILRFRHEKIPQEAVIGLVYAIAAAIVILVIDKAPHGAEHIKELLTGSILWVKWETIFQASLVYLFVGAFHFIYRKKFLLISNNPEEAYRQGINVRFWDFLFYVTFGIVITHSVGTAGVLLVFVFLVVPAIASILITDVLWKQLVIGWSMGVIVSVLGLFISYIGDFPSGPTVVAFYGLMLLLVALVLYIYRSEQRKKALLNIFLGLVVTTVIFFAFRGMGDFFKNYGHIEHQHIDVELNHDENAEIVSGEEHEKVLPDMDIEKLEKMYNSAGDADEKLQIAQQMVEINESEGISKIISLLKISQFPYLREEMIKAIEEKSHNRFGYDSSKSAEENSDALKKLDKWYFESYTKKK